MHLLGPVPQRRNICMMSVKAAQVGATEELGGVGQLLEAVGEAVELARVEGEALETSRVELAAGVGEGGSGEVVGVGGEQAKPGVGVSQGAGEVAQEGAAGGA